LTDPAGFPSKFRRPEDSPGFLLWQVTNSWQRRIRHALKAIGLTHVQFVLLTATEWLNDAEMSTTQTNVARFARTDVMMTSQVIRTLEVKGLVTIQENAADSRAHLLRVTPTGRRLVKRALDLVEDADGVFFGPLAGDSARFTEMLRLLIEPEKH
jgi:MarR family transcriptional regulator, organic hydroperoxide resistance regulator